MTNLTKKEIEQTEEMILNAIVEEINNQVTTFNFMKKIYLFGFIRQVHYRKQNKLLEAIMLLLVFM